MIEFDIMLGGRSLIGVVANLSGQVAAAVVATVFVAFAFGLSGCGPAGGKSLDAGRDGGDGRDGDIQDGETAACAADALDSGGCTDSGVICPLGPGGIAASPVLAQRLARFLWNQSTADEELLTRVAGAPAGHLRDVASWMLKDARARDGVMAFIRSWLRLDDLDSIQKPGGVLTTDLIESMKKEAPTFAASVILDGDARYQTLMLAPYTYVDETLAAHYGIGGVSGSGMRKVSFDVSDRVGLLGGAGVLTRYSGTLDPPWPPRRFWLTYETMLCDSSRLPPAVPQSTRFDPTVTIQQDLEMHTSGPPCNSCHVTVNPIGNAFSKFDTFGRYRPLDENGAPTQTAETIPAGLTVNTGLTVSGAADLIQQLTERPEVRRCFSARWLDYALDPVPRAETVAVDVLPTNLQCDLSQVDAAFEASHGDIRELILAIVETGAFMKAP